MGSSVKYELSYAGIVDHPSVCCRPDEGGWWAYATDGLGAGGVPQCPGKVMSGAVDPGAWQADVDAAIAANGWRWVRGSEWVELSHGTPWELAYVSWHRPLAVDRRGAIRSFGRLCSRVANFVGFFAFLVPRSDEPLA